MAVDERMIRMARLYTENVAAISLYFRPQIWADASIVRGPRVSAPDTSSNMPQWQLQ